MKGDKVGKIIRVRQSLTGTVSEMRSRWRVSSFGMAGADIGV